VIVVGILGASGDAVLEIARRAAATGARAEVVGVAPLGAVGDRLLLTLASAGVGHATAIRSDARGIEPADLELALRYLPDVRAIVLVAPSAALLAPAIAASSWSGAAMVVVGTLDADALAALGPSEAAAATRDADGTLASGGTAVVRVSGPIVLDPPARDPDGAFAGLVAALAARLDAGEDPVTAWQATTSALAVDRA
jgi:hypothetical protein